MISFLQKYVQIQTVYPLCNYADVVDLFEQQAGKDGLVFQKIDLPCGNPVIIITLFGSDPSLPALALNHHMDVVPVTNDDEWIFPPFSAVVSDGIMYGRGTQDCKALGVMHYVAMQRLKRLDRQPIRTIHLIIVPDEERGGFLGTHEFINHPLFKTLNIGYVVDEGFPSGNSQELYIKVDERTPLQIKVTSKGLQAHASGLLSENCTYSLINFLYEINQFQHEQRKKCNHNKVDVGSLMSAQITSLSTDTQVLNVIPGVAQATIDIRVPSLLSMIDALEWFESILKKYPELSYRVEATSVQRCKPVGYDSVLYQKMAQAITKCGFKPVAFSFEATTDARFYSSLGIETIGCTPLRSLPLLHATNESMSIQDFEIGCDVLFSFVYLFCLEKY